MNNVLQLVIPIFGLIFLGFFAAKVAKHSERGLDWLNTFVIYFSLPALFYKLLSKTPFDQLTNWPYVLATTSTTAIIFVIIVAYALFLGRKLDEAAVCGAAAGYGNIGYMGLGIGLVALGPAAAVPITLIICFDNLLFFVAVPLLIALGGAGSKSLLLTIREIALKVILHPFIVASIAGVTAAYFQIKAPGPIEKLIDYLSDAAAPCALFALGVTIAAQRLKRIPSELPVILFAKLILHPILAYYIVSTFVSAEPVWLLAAVLLASLPTAANVFILASQYGVYVERTSSVILIGTIVSVITVTFVLYLIKQGVIN